MSQVTLGMLEMLCALSRGRHSGYNGWQVKMENSKLKMNLEIFFHGKTLMERTELNMKAHE